MYKFIDSTEEALDGVLPSEALSINGEYIENLIEGYRTLHVSGRESLSAEIESFEVGLRDGSDVLYRRYPARTIIVTYQLISKTNEAFRKAYNKLGGILNVDDARLIFNDEQDVFYTGTPTAIGEVEPGINSVVGEFEIYCADPFKYSVVEYEATQSLDESSILLDYNGTHASFPILEADFYSETDGDGETETPLTGAGDCGYVAFFNEDERIIQLGDPDEIDGIEGAYPKSQTLVNSKFDKSNSYGTSAKAQWKQNAALAADIEPNFAQAGAIGMTVGQYGVPANPKSTSATLLNNRATTQGAPIFYYTVKAKTSNRTAKSVKVTFSITASLKYTTSYFGYGFGLKAQIYIGGAWHPVTLKTPSAYWRGQTGHTVNLTVIVSDLSETATSISGIKFKVDRTDSLAGYDKVTGEISVNLNNLPISSYAAEVPELYYLTSSSFGSGEAWHGATVTRTIPKDSSGATGSVNGKLTYAHRFSIGEAKSNTDQYGRFMALLVSGSGTSRKIVAGAEVKKNASGKTCRVILYVNNEIVYKTDISCAYNNKYFKSTVSSTITKTGDTVTFNIGGIKKTFKDEDIKDLKITECTFAFLQYKTKPVLSYNGLFSAKFVKNNCNTVKDIPNKFSADDVLEADCKSGEIRLNGVLAPELGALGNDWETFFLTPGLNQIGIAYSEWVPSEYKPTFKVRYREVFT